MKSYLIIHSTLWRRRVVIGYASYLENVASYYTFSRGPCISTIEKAKQDEIWSRPVCALFKPDSLHSGAVLHWAMISQPYTFFLGTNLRPILSPPPSDSLALLLNHYALDLICSRAQQLRVTTPY